MRFAYYEPPWGFPTEAVAQHRGQFFDIRDNGWGGYVAEPIPLEKLKPAMKRGVFKARRLAPQPGWRDAVKKCLLGQK